MILSREQVAELKSNIESCCCQEENCFEECEGGLGCKNESNLIETIEHLQQESDRRELAHEKARRAVEVERDRLKEIIQAQKDYIEFLEKQIGIEVPTGILNEGLRLRMKIWHAEKESDFE